MTNNQDVHPLATDQVDDAPVSDPQFSKSLQAPPKGVSKFLGVYAKPILDGLS